MLMPGGEHRRECRCYWVTRCHWVTQPLLAVPRMLMTGGEHRQECRCHWQRPTMVAKRRFGFSVRQCRQGWRFARAARCGWLLTAFAAGWWRPRGPGVVRETGG